MSGEIRLTDIANSFGLHHWRNHLTQFRASPLDESSHIVISAFTSGRTFFAIFLGSCTQDIAAEERNEENPEIDGKSAFHSYQCRCSNKVFAIFSIVLVVISLGAIGTLTYLCIKQTHTKASHLLANMNHRVDPCVDFYDFACGQRITNLARNSKKSVHLKSILEDKIKERIRGKIKISLIGFYGT
ncbi:hypothetical protein Btru_067002 [Bulinus truncatus]|nr:hypothetical protein Btru_067002 [Bulinus truncatus]